MDPNQRLDDELAALTDAVLENQAMQTQTRTQTQTNDTLNDLADVVRGLNALIEPHQQPPDLFQARMRQRLDAEWDLRQRRTVRPRISPVWRVASAAAVLVLALVAVLMLSRGGGEAEGLPGTAQGSPEAVLTVVLLAAVAGAAVVLWRSRR